MEGWIKEEFRRMKEKFKLVKLAHTLEAKGITDTLTYKPTLKPYDEYVKLTVSGPLVEEITNSLGFPTKLGDVMVFEMTGTEEQTELPGKGENGKKGHKPVSKAGK